MCSLLEDVIYARTLGRGREALAFLEEGGSLMIRDFSLCLIFGELDLCVRLYSLMVDLILW